jgi:hypothetical protein
MDIHNSNAIRSWFTGRLPDEWTSVGQPSIDVDREEITVTLTLAAPLGDDGTTELDTAQAAAGRIAGFREDTREQRMSIAREAEHRFERKVAWAVSIGDQTEIFSHLAVPVMTRLRQPERLVLDTLVAANIARSRAEAVAWCVRLVGQHADDWLGQLRNAMVDVERIRDAGPDLA